MSNWLIYPYQSNHKWLIEEKNDFKYFDKLKAVATDSWDTSLTKTESIISDKNFKEEMKTSDGLWIVQSDFDLDFYDYILPKIKYAVNQGKHIFCTRKLEKNELELLTKIVPDAQWCTVNNEKIENVAPNTIFDIDVPVLLLVGMSEKINNVEQILCIQRQFKEKGYKTVAFSDAKEIMLFQEGYWLSMLSEKNTNQAEKVMQTNYYIKQIETNEDPDLILIGMMQGTATLGRTFVENFGIDVYSIAQAVRPDCVVMNVSFGYYGQDDLEALGEETKAIIGEKIDYFNIVNKVIDLRESDTKNKVCTIEVDKELVEKELGHFCRNKVFCMSIMSESERLVSEMIDKLASYTEIISM